MPATDSSARQWQLRSRFPSLNFRGSMTEIAAYGKLSISSVMYSTQLCTVGPAARRRGPHKRAAVASLKCTKSRGLEELQQIVVCPEPLWDHVGILKPGQCLLHHGEIGLNVLVHRRRTLVSEPHGDFGDVHARLRTYVQFSGTASWRSTRAITAPGAFRLPNCS